MANKSHGRPRISNLFAMQEGLWEYEDSQNGYENDWYDDYYDYMNYDIDFLIKSDELDRWKFCQNMHAFPTMKEIAKKYTDVVLFNNGFCFGYKVSHNSYFHYDGLGACITFYYNGTENIWDVQFEYNKSCRWNGAVELTGYTEKKFKCNNLELDKYIMQYYEQLNKIKKAALKCKIKNIGRMEWED